MIVERIVKHVSGRRARSCVNFVVGYGVVNITTDGGGGMAGGWVLEGGRGGNGGRRGANSFFEL